MNCPICGEKMRLAETMGPGLMDFVLQTVAEESEVGGGDQTKKNKLSFSMSFGGDRASTGDSLNGEGERAHYCPDCHKVFAEFDVRAPRNGVYIKR